MTTDRTDPNRHLPPHPRSVHCVEGVCLNVAAPLTLALEAKVYRDAAEIVSGGGALDREAGGERQPSGSVARTTSTTDTGGES